MLSVPLDEEKRGEKKEVYLFLCPFRRKRGEAVFPSFQEKKGELAGQRKEEARSYLSRAPGAEKREKRRWGGPPGFHTLPQKKEKEGRCL